MWWSGPICADQPQPAVFPDPEARPLLAPVSPAAEPSTTYRYLVVKCEQLPATVMTPEQVETIDVPGGDSRECVRAPAGVLFHVRFDDGDSELALTDGNGEFAFQKPLGVAAEVELPQGGAGRFPSLLGYQPMDIVDRIPASDAECVAETLEACKRVYVLVP